MTKLPDYINPGATVLFVELIRVSVQPQLGTTLPDIQTDFGNY